MIVALWLEEETALPAWVLETTNRISAAAIRTKKKQRVSDQKARPH